MIPIILPLIAVILPVMVIRRAEKSPVRDPFMYSVGSYLCGFGALLQEIWTIYRRVMSGDMGGVEDTIGAVLIISIGIVLVVSGLNFMALYLSYGKDE